jgi:broad specificity phosphatase PhoE
LIGLALPENIVLVRNGESTERTKDLKEYLQGIGFDSKRQLSKIGEKQAVEAGEVCRKFLELDKFDTFLVSSSTRSLETAKRLAMPSAKWEKSFLLSDRYWGMFQGIPYSELKGWSEYRYFLNDLKNAFFIARPPGGDSFADLMVRAKILIEQLSSSKNAIIVTHNHFLLAFRAIMEHLQEEDLYEMQFGTNNYPGGETEHCEIIQYTRRNPLHPFELKISFDWRRVINRSTAIKGYCVWNTIEKKFFQNEEL